MKEKEMRENNIGNPEDRNSGAGEKFSDIGKFLWEIVKVVLLAVVIIVPIRVFLFQPFFVQGASMEPNFEDGEYLIVNELGYKFTNVGAVGVRLFTVKSFKDYDRGDVVIFHPPREEGKYFIKRIISLPGETVEIKNGKVSIIDKNGQEALLDEHQYLDNSVFTSGNMTRKLADDEYFMMGDNRPVSSDSRSWGPVKKEKIIGKVLLRAWPVSKMAIY